jgi:hypothetical protein
VSGRRIVYLEFFDDHEATDLDGLMRRAGAVGRPSFYQRPVAPIEAEEVVGFVMGCGSDHLFFQEQAEGTVCVRCHARS